MSASQQGHVETLGGRIIEAREAAGFSSAQLARRIGVGTPTLASWEQDRSEPRANKLVTLAGLLNVNFSWLLTGDGPSPVSTDRDSELAQIKASLELLKGQTEAVAEQIDRIVERIDTLQHYGD